MLLFEDFGESLSKIMSRSGLHLAWKLIGYQWIS